MYLGLVTSLVSSWTAPRYTRRHTFVSLIVSSNSATHEDASFAFRAFSGVSETFVNTWVETSRASFLRGRCVGMGKAMVNRCQWKTVLECRACSRGWKRCDHRNRGNMTEEVGKQWASTLAARHTHPGPFPPA